MNEQIRAEEVRLVDLDGQQAGVVSIAKALSLAEEANVDLIEVVPNATPPVCRLANYGKYLFEQTKKKSQAKKNQKKTQLKEVKLRHVTDVGDYQVKLRNLIKFLNNDDKVKVTIRFKGREMTHQELGRNMLIRIANDADEYSLIEQRPRLEGRQMVMILGPKKK